MRARWRFFVEPNQTLDRYDLAVVMEYYESELDFQMTPKEWCPTCSQYPALLERNHGVLSDSAVMN